MCIQSLIRAEQISAVIIVTINISSFSIAINHFLISIPKTFVHMSLMALIVDIFPQKQCDF